MTTSNLTIEPMSGFLPELAEITAQREASYRESPDSRAPKGPQASLKLRVTSIGHLDELVETPRNGRSWRISEPTYVGGLDNAPWPLEYLLSGAVGCFAAVFAFYAAKYQVPYESFVVEASTEFDVSGHTIEDAPPSGFKHLTMDVRIVSDAPAADLERVHQAALRGCPGIDTLRSPVEINSAISVSGQ